MRNELKAFARAPARENMNRRRPFCYDDASVVVVLFYAIREKSHFLFPLYVHRIIDHLSASVAHLYVDNNCAARGVWAVRCGACG